MRVPAIALALLSFVTATSAAGPGGTPDAPLTTFRIETGEVHIAFSAFDKKSRPVLDVSAADFRVLRDGEPLPQSPAVERRHDSPIEVTVMTDVSESMIKAVPMARESWGWMDSNLLRAEDEVTYFDFGREITASGAARQSKAYLTSFYDCLYELIPRIRERQHGRKVLILFTDGIDNMSLHGMEDALRMAVQRDIAIYAITTWKYKINYDERVLDSLTSKTGGRLFVVKDAKEMDGALTGIVEELRNGYELVFRAENGRTGVHQIAMMPTNPHWKFYHRTAYYQTPRPPEPTVVAAGR